MYFGGKRQGRSMEVRVVLLLRTMFYGTFLDCTYQQDWIPVCQYCPIKILNTVIFITMPELKWVHVLGINVVGHDLSKSSLDFVFNFGMNWLNLF